MNETIKNRRKHTFCQNEAAACDGEGSVLRNDKRGSFAIGWLHPAAGYSTGGSVFYTNRFNSPCLHIFLN